MALAKDRATAGLIATCGAVVVGLLSLLTGVRLWEAEPALAMVATFGLVFVLSLALLVVRRLARRASRER